MRTAKKIDTSSLSIDDVAARLMLAMLQFAKDDELNEIPVTHRTNTEHALESRLQGTVYDFRTAHLSGDKWSLRKTYIAARFFSKHHDS